MTNYVIYSQKFSKESEMESSVKPNPPNTWHRELWEMYFFLLLLFTHVYQLIAKLEASFIVVLHLYKMHTNYTITVNKHSCYISNYYVQY